MIGSGVCLEPAQVAEAFAQGGMAVVESAVDRCGGGVAQVVFVQLEQGVAEGIRAVVCVVRGEGVRLVFVLSRDGMGEGVDPEEHGAAEEVEHEKGRRDGVLCEAESLIEPRRIGQQKQGEESGEHAQCREHQCLRDMPQLIVSDLVCEHGFEFIVGELVDQRIEEDDLAKAAEAGEEGVGVRASPAAVHDLNGRGLESGPIGQGEQPFSQGAVGQGGELVEEGQNQNGRQDEHGQLEQEDDTPCPEPPRKGCPAGQEEDESGQRQTEQDPQKQDLDMVGDPEAEGCFVEAEALFEAKLRIPIQRQVRDGEDDGDGQEKTCVGPDPGAPEGDVLLICVGQDSGEDDDEQDDCAPAILDEAEPAFRVGVCERFGERLAVQSVSDLCGGSHPVQPGMSKVDSLQQGLRRPAQEDEQGSDDQDGIHEEGLAWESGQSARICSMALISSGVNAN